MAADRQVLSAAETRTVPNTCNPRFDETHSLCLDDVKLAVESIDVVGAKQPAYAVYFELSTAKLLCADLDLASVIRAIQSPGEKKRFELELTDARKSHGRGHLVVQFSFETKADMVLPPMYVLRDRTTDEVLQFFGAWELRVRLLELKDLMGKAVTRSSTSSFHVKLRLCQAKAKVSVRSSVVGNGLDLSGDELVLPLRDAFQGRALRGVEGKERLQVGDIEILLIGGKAQLAATQVHVCGVPFLDAPSPRTPPAPATPRHSSLGGTATPATSTPAPSSISITTPASTSLSRSTSESYAAGPSSTADPGFQGTTAQATALPSGQQDLQWGQDNWRRYERRMDLAGNMLDRAPLLRVDMRLVRTGSPGS
ncbi:hypothetical protein HYH03_014120 [Edaphochlamys debaryana]|uniref:Uncharacterized protein n=1 Tax=Edaphochlamys debaryana TaxID=47281 RepID=A0A835XWZ0_9CHLO|nr:hypothetical protein HYH03_014120 [Edaphochlamys debaryana]|eukprot:KAG2487279.1 hypothetical protein HYH03_014120 [Edaphochlamys debaryana]